VDVDSALEEGVRGAGKHDRAQELFQLASLRAQDGRPEDAIASYLGMGVSP
jgi:hypothetical protein